MILALFVVLLTLLTIYVGCNRPVWMWTAISSSAVLLTVAGTLLKVDASNIPFGPVTLRAIDPGLAGVLVGTIYHLRHEGSRVFRGKPLIWVVGAMLAFLAVKVLWTLLFGQDQIAANATASHALGGLVAAGGELRDTALAFLLTVYVYAARRSYDLRALGLPILTAICVLLAKAGFQIAQTGQVWSNNADYRFVGAEEAISLTIFSFLIFFLPIPRLSTPVRRAFAIGTYLIALVANHRSQWVGALAGTSVLLLIVLLGRPLLGESRLNRIAVSGAAFLVVLGIAVISTLSALADRFPIIAVLSVRLYAITQPSRDADAVWRETIWRDRIRQVGENWPWGRLLGDRRSTLIHGQWLTVPDHSAYVTTYEIGGVILCVLVGMFWLGILFYAWRQLRTSASPEQIWPPAVAVAICASTLAFASGYDFPPLAPAFCLVMLLGSVRQASRARTPAFARARVEGESHLDQTRRWSYL